MRIACVEDNKEERKYLMKLISNWQKEKDPTGQSFDYSSAQSFLFDYEEMIFDVALLDIKMEYISGMELAKMLRRENDDIIICFITGEKEYVFEGYNVEAVDYILKPVGQREINNLLDKVFKKLEKKEKNIIINTVEGLITVPISKILFIEAQNHKTFIKTEIGDFETGTTLSKWEEKLKKEFFIKPHRSFLIHCGWISRVTKKDVVLNSKYHIPIARGRWEDVAQALLNYRRNEVWD